MRETEKIEFKLENAISEIESLQQNLYKYLEEKRNQFARLYFLGDDDLLELLCHSEDQKILESHLKKIFSGIHSIELYSM